MKRRLTCAVLALCLLLSGCAATGTTSPQRYSVTWWDVFDTVTVISGYADSEADWNTQMTALHADLLRYNQLSSACRAGLFVFQSASLSA